MTNVVKILENITIPAGISNKTHFLCVKGNDVVAIERTKDMLEKAKKTRQETAKKQKEKQAKKQAVALEKAQRQATREEIAQIRKDYKQKMEEIRQEQILQKELLASKLKKLNK